MDVRRKRILFGVAEAVVILAAVFLLLDAVLGFTRHRGVPSAQPRPASPDTGSGKLAASCRGGFSNERTVHGVTQVASHGMPFNAYQVTLTNRGSAAVTVHSVSVELVNSRNEIFARHRTELGHGAGITLNPGRSRRIVEAYGISHPVASCEIAGWQP